MFGDIIRKTVSLFGKPSTYSEPVALEVTEIPQEVEQTKTRMEFNIGVFGTVSAGKSTLINAIFSKRFSQMNIRRTTMVPQRYQLSNQGDAKQYEEIRASNDEVNVKFQNSMWDGETVLHHVVDTPNNFIDGNDNTDFQFNVYDFPGLNDQTTKDVYMKWTENNIAMFDVIILVVDIHSGMNTSDEVDVLRVFLSGMLANPHISLIVLANKCDDMIYDDSKDVFVTDEERESIYAEQMVPMIMKMANEYQVDASRITIQKFCSRTAFIYRTIHANGEDTLTHLDDKHLTEMMQNEVGRTRWVRMTEKQREAHISTIINEVVNDQGVYDSNMVHSGFTKLVETLRTLITEPTQLLPIYQANIKSVISGIHRHTEEDDDDATQLEDAVELINSMSIGDDIKESLMQTVTDRFLQMHKQPLPTTRNCIYSYRCLLTKLLDWHDFITQFPFCSEIQKESVQTTVQVKTVSLVEHLSSESFQSPNNLEFDTEEFQSAYDDTFSRLGALTNTNERFLADLIPLKHPSVWNDVEYIQWACSKMEAETKKSKLQQYITYFLNEQLSTVTPASAMFLHHIKYNASFDKLDFINKICVDQCLLQAAIKGVTLDHTERKCLEVIQNEMMESFGSFFDVVIGLIQ